MQVQRAHNRDVVSHVLSETTDDLSFRPGTMTNVVIHSDHPCELLTSVEHVCIWSKKMPADSRQNRFLRRYLALDGIPHTCDDRSP